MEETSSASLISALSASSGGARGMGGRSGSSDSDSVVGAVLAGFCKGAKVHPQTERARSFQSTGFMAGARECLVGAFAT